jgi:hypothetical protein
MDIAKIQSELGWEPRETFDSGLRKTVSWYLENRCWWEPIWLRRYRGERLGVGDRCHTHEPQTAGSKGRELSSPAVPGHGCSQ